MAFRDDDPLEKVGPLPRHGAHRAGLDARPRPPLDRRPVARRGGDAALAASSSTASAGRLRLDGFTLTSHHFMSPAELRTPVGQDRLAACVFRLPYKGEMVPMCQMNADGVRERFYAGITAGEMDLEPAERASPASRPLTRRLKDSFQGGQISGIASRLFRR